MKVLDKISKGINDLILNSIILIVFSSIGHAQRLDVEWSNMSNVAWENHIPTEAIDSKGNIYLLGQLKDSISLLINNKSKEFISESTYRYYLQKVNKKGETLWLNLLDSNIFFIQSTFTINDQDELSVLSAENYESRTKQTFYYNALNEEGTVNYKKPVFTWTGSYPFVIAKKSIAGINGSSFHLFLFKDTITLPNNVKIINGLGDDYLLLKINGAGEVGWHNHIKHGTINSLSVDQDGNTYLAGHYNYSIVINNDTTKRTWSNGHNGFVIRYNDSKSTVDQFHMGSTNSIEINGVTASADGDIYITGSFYGGLDVVIDGDSIPKRPYTRAFLLKMNHNYDPQWIRYLGNGSTVEGLDVFANSNGSINWIGYVSASIDIDPTDEVKHLPRGTFIHQYTAQGNFNWSAALSVDPTHHRARIIPAHGDVFFILKEGVSKSPKYTNGNQIEFFKVKNSPIDQSKSLYIRNCTPFTWEATGKTYTASGTYYTRGKKDSLRFELVKPITDVTINGLALAAVEPEATYSWYNISQNWEKVGEGSRFIVKETGRYVLIVNSKECPKVDTSESIFKEVVFIPDSILQRFYKADSDIIFPKIEREHIQLIPDDVSMIPYRHDNLFGFVEKGQPGNWLIPPKFDQVYAVYAEGAIVKDTNYRKYVGGYGLVNEKGEYLIPPRYPNLFKERNIYHGLLNYGRDTSLHLPEKYAEFNRHDYYNTKGDLLFSENSHEHQSFQNENFAWFRFGTTYHIYNLTGKLVKTFEWEQGRTFIGIADSLLIFNTNSQTEAYSMDDELIFKLTFFTYSKVYRLSDNLFGLMSTQTNDYYFVDSLGKSKSYGNISSSVGFFKPDERFFDESNFIVQNRDRTALGIINLDGDIILDFKYLQIGILNSGVRICQDTSKKWTVVDSIGNVVYSYYYGRENKVYPINNRRKSLLINDISFYDGLSIGLGNKLMDAFILDSSNYFSNLDYDDSTYYYYYDTKGEIQLKLPCDIQLAGYFSEGLAPAIDSIGQLGFINKLGEWVITPKYELTFAGSYPFPYPVIPEFKNGYAYIKSFKGYIDKEGREYFSGEQLKDHYNFSH